MCFPGGSLVKNLPAIQKTWVHSLGQEDPLEKEMATHSGFLAWEIPWTEEPGGLQSMGSQRVGHNSATKTILCIHTHTYKCTNHTYILMICFTDLILTFCNSYEYYICIWACDFTSVYTCTHNVN